MGLTGLMTHLQSLFAGRSKRRSSSATYPGPRPSWGTRDHVSETDQSTLEGRRSLYFVSLWSGRKAKSIKFSLWMENLWKWKLFDVWTTKGTLVAGRKWDLLGRTCRPIREWHLVVVKSNDRNSLPLGERVFSFSRCGRPKVSLGNYLGPRL